MNDWAVPGFTELTRLGEGGFGRVVLARHNASGRVVAIKYLFGGGDRTQFRHEAAILRRVVSPYVARLYEFVEDARGAAIIMEAVPGVSLKDILARHGLLAPEPALAILKGSLLGLAAAHAAGTVHRDYKPGNVLVQPNHQSKLVDFGIALLSGHSGHSSGTPAYMAPEQWRGGFATPATDVYAATCVFFLCVTGSRPYDGDTEELRGLHEQAPVPVERAPDPVRALLARGMAKDPTLRPVTAAAFVAELEATAAAAYGTDWERAGWERLAGLAGTLLAVSPMAWVVSSTGVLTGVGGTAAAGGAAGAAGTAGTVAAAKAAVAAKVAAAVIGAAVVAGGTIIAVEAAGDDPPAAAQEVFSVNTTTERASYEVNIDVTAEIVQVSGHASTGRVNEALRAPVEEKVEELRENVANLRELLEGEERADDPVKVPVSADIRLHNSRYLSVRYHLQPESDLITNSSWQSYGTVTIDLQTGEPVDPTTMYEPVVLTEDGMDELAQLLIDNSPDALCADPTAASELELEPENLGREVVVAFARDRAEFTIALPLLGHANACGMPTVAVPYDDLREVLDPALIAGLTTG